MQSRKLGNTDLDVPVVTLGAWAIGGGYWGPTDDGLAHEAIGAALDAGLVAIDTAPIYGLGHSERIVGKAIAGRRDEVLLMSKVGLRWDASEGLLFVKSNDPNKSDIYKNSRPESVTMEIDASLKRLGVDHIDLIQVHWHDPTTPIADTMGALLEACRQGKVRAIGVSNYDTHMLEEARVALGDVPLASVQSKYNLVARDLEQDVLPYAREHDVAVLSYSTIEQGLLTGKVTEARSFADDEGRSRRPTFQVENRRRVNALLSRVVAPIAEAHDATLAQVVIAWTVAQPGITSAIVGVRRPDQARENAAAGALRLTAAEWSSIDEAFAGLALEPAPSSA